MITDTQILSYYYKGRLVLPSDPIRICSITAAEFLLIHSGEPHRANYYPILPSHLFHGGGALISTESPKRFWESRKHAAMGKSRTDQLLIDFGAQMPSYVEFGSLAITQIINGQNSQAYAISISHLEKSMRKTLQDRICFLFDIGVQCVALTGSTAMIGVNLLAQFLERYQGKQNMRNTVNDVLILGTALAESEPLLTEDKLLRRFAAEIVGAQCQERDGGGLLIDFKLPGVRDKRKLLESKGYVNRGWQILERRGRL